MDLLTNATVVDDAIGFISDRSKEKIRLSSDNSNEDYKEGSNEPDYDKDQLEEEQEEQTGEITINQVFQDTKKRYILLLNN
jgi:hypothetical protein